MLRNNPGLFENIGQIIQSSLQAQPGWQQQQWQTPGQEGQTPAQPAAAGERRVGGWAKKRVVIVSGPEDSLEGKAGESVATSIVVSNQTHKPWPRTVTLKQISEGAQLLENEIVLAEELPGDEVLEVQMLLKVPAYKGIYKTRFGFFNPKGFQIGEEVSLVVKSL